MIAAEEALADGNNNTAQNKLSFITAQNNIENNYKTFYNLYLKYTTDTITGSDSLELVQLANGCPFTDGPAVYQARALYNVVYSTVVVFEDDCPTEPNNGRVWNKEENSNIENKDFDVLLYPNPASDELFIAPFELQKGEIAVEIRDMNGKLVYKENTNLSEGVGQIKLNVSNGVYFVKITNFSTQQCINKKLVIQQ